MRCLRHCVLTSISTLTRRPANGRNRDDDESADVDVDLSPQVNTALRSEILYYTTSGIKESVRAVSDELITIPISGESEKVRRTREHIGRLSEKRVC